MKKWISLATMTALIALTGCQSASGEEEQTFTLAHNQPTIHPVHQSLERFAELVEEKSDGNMSIKIYPNGELGSEREVIEGTQTGAVDFSKVSASALESFEPAYSVFSLPYLFESQETFKRVMNDEDVTNDIYTESTDKGFRGLTYYDAGVRNVYTKSRMIETSEDMSGLKTRVQPSQTSVQMIEAMGGTPTPMSYGEVYTALQSGVIDAAENNVTALTSHGDVTENYFYTEHAIVPDILISNENTMQSLSESERHIINEAAEESTVYHEDLWNETVDQTITDAKEEMNVEFHEVDKQSFIDEVQPLHEEFQNDPDTSEIYNKIKEAE